MIKQILFGCLSFTVVGAMAASAAGTDYSLREHCQAVGKAFGINSPKMETYVNGCFNMVVERARADRKLFAVAQSGAVKVYGAINLIYIQRGSKLTLISGNMARINAVENVAVSSDGKTIAVLDAFKDQNDKVKKQILFFESSLNGNVVPFSVNNEDYVSSAQSITFADTKNDELLMLLQRSGAEAQKEQIEVVQVNNARDSRSPVEALRPKATTLMSVAKSVSKEGQLSLVTKNNQIVVLDSTNGLQFFRLEEGKYALKSEIKSSDPVLASLKDLHHLAYNPNKKMLLIYDSSGSSSQLPL